MEMRLAMRGGWLAEHAAINADMKDGSRNSYSGREVHRWYGA
jgi:hypothetical protein